MIPADEGKAVRDLEVYESALAIVDAGGKSGLIQIGELVKVGQVWKLTSIPVPLAGDTVQVTAGGVLLQPAAPSVAVTTPGVTPKMQKLLDQLRELDSSPPTAGTPCRVVELPFSSQRRPGWFERGGGDGFGTGSVVQAIDRQPGVVGAVRNMARGAATIGGRGDPVETK